MYFKIAVREFNAPLKLVINHKESEFLKGKKPDLTLYFSFTSKQPSQQDNCRASHNPKGQVRIYAPGSNRNSTAAQKFTNDWLYICMHSNTGCSLEFTALFHEEEAQLASSVPG